MSNGLIKYLQLQSFQPGFVGLFTNRFYFIRRALYKAIRKEAPRLKGKMMDFGCGRKPYENLFHVDEYIGVDTQQTGHDHSLSKADVFYDGKTIPFSDNTFDAVFCCEVMEHVFNPDEILPEIRRVLNPGGKILISVPFCWNEHEIPYDYARYTSFGISHLLKKHGFQILHHYKTGNFARVNVQLSALYFYELFKKYGRIGYALSMIPTVAINIFGTISLPLLPKNETLYFNNIVVAVK